MSYPSEMASERSFSKEFSNPINSLVNITILVVDDDSTSLAIISAMLREWRYEVATVKSPVDALSTLREHPGIDLVVTDLHMPEMNGLELQRQINREFRLPVIIMSSDDKESVMLQSLEGGAVFFIVKPVKPDDLRNVWQYAIAAKKGKSVVIEEIGSTDEGAPPPARRLANDEVTSVASVKLDEKKNAKRGTKRKASRKGKDDEEDETASAPKKAKVVWTNSLHNKFLEALRKIGLDKAVPKKILEHMNVPGLTRENVASHLQKYRIFLRRVAERGCFQSKAFVEKILKSSFAAGHPMLLKTAQEYARLLEEQERRGLAFHPGYGGSVSYQNARTATYQRAHNTSHQNAHDAANLGSLLFPYQNASGSNSAQPHGYGQSRLLSGNQPNNKRNVSVKTNPLYQSNRLGFANGSNFPLNGGLINSTNGLMNGANYMHAYQQQIQARTSFQSAGSSSQFRFGSSSLHSSNSALGTGNRGTSSTSYPILNSNFSFNNRYSGIRLTTDGQVIGMGPTLLNGCYGSMNGNYKAQKNGAAMGNQTFGYMGQGGSSSSRLTGANQVSHVNTAANKQANTLMLPGLDSFGGARHMSGHLMNFASTFDNITPQQLGDGSLSDLLTMRNEQINGAAMGNQTFSYMGLGGSSSSGLTGASQVSPVNTAANKQANTFMLPGLDNNGGASHKSSNLMNNASTFDNTIPQHLGDDSLSDLLLTMSNEQMNGAAMGNQMFGYMGQGGSSSSGITGANQVSSVNTAANTSVLPGIDNNGEASHKFGRLMNNASTLDNITSKQLDCSLSDLLLELKNCQIPSQQQAGGDDVQNPDFLDSSIFPEIFPSLEELLNADFSVSLSLKDTAPDQNEQALDKVQSGDENLMNTDADGTAHPTNDYYPTNLIQSTNQQQNVGDQVTCPELSSTVQVINNNASASGDNISDSQNWGDDFVNSLLSFGSQFE